MQKKRSSISQRLLRDWRQYRGAYLLGFIVLVYYIVFYYKPLLGSVIAFEDFSPRKGIWASNWVGFKHFESFFNSNYFGRIMKNTIKISLCGILFNFPIPIIFALSLNEVKNQRFKKTVQTVSYMPHFISLVVVCSMIRLFVDKNGFIVQLLNLFGGQYNQSLLNISGAFVPIYIGSGVWQEMGWNCIIYLAALSAIDPHLYEAARIDGANRWKQTLHVTLPGISGTVILLLILRIGSVMSVGHEKIILLYNDFTMDSADVISSYVYRRGLVKGDWSFSTAVGLFNSVINFALVLTANWLSNRASGHGLW